MKESSAKRPSIVVLDGYALNPGDCPWEEVAALGDLTVHDRTPPELVVERCRDADIVLTNKCIVDAAAIAALERLGYISVLATGYNVVDVTAAAARGIPVSNVPEYGTASVAQFVFALILELAHHIGEHHAAVKRGDWSKGPDYSFRLSLLRELAGKTLAVVGFGRIGRAVGGDRPRLWHAGAGRRPHPPGPTVVEAIFLVHGGGGFRAR
jgi:glycerate dehydrogenase